MLLKLLISGLKANHFFLQDSNVLFQLKILLIQYSLILFYSFQQGVTDSFLSDHDAFFIDRNQVVSFCWRTRVSIRAGIMRDE